MKFIHTVIIEQLQNGETCLTQETRKEGDGRPSEQMNEAMRDYFNAFGEFFGNYGMRPMSAVQLIDG